MPVSKPLMYANSRNGQARRFCVGLVALVLFSLLAATGPRLAGRYLDRLEALSVHHQHSDIMTATGTAPGALRVARHTASTFVSVGKTTNPATNPTMNQEALRVAYHLGSVRLRLWARGQPVWSMGRMRLVMVRQGRRGGGAYLTFSNWKLSLGQTPAATVQSGTVQPGRAGVFASLSGC